MTNTEHTPAPWSVQAREDGHNFPFYVLHEAKEDIDGVEHAANARLIAAAPELLAIATAYRNLLRTMASTDNQVATFEHIERVLSSVEGK